jgi:hypothetical protein
MNRLYVFYNCEVGAEGKPFAMCDKCKKKYKTPDGLIMREIAKHASESCQCGDHAD